uniref:Uncharacterized protein n=1 Tax=Arundo donax TaxID=35708 RepID=A0A0A9ABR3_ARUDO
MCLPITITAGITAITTLSLQS